MVKKDTKNGSDSNAEHIEQAYSDSDDNGKTVASRGKKKELRKFTEGKKKRLRKDEGHDNEGYDKENEEIEMMEKDEENNYGKRRNSNGGKDKRFSKSSKFTERGIFKRSGSFKGKKKAVAVSAFIRRGKEKSKERKSSAKTIVESPRKEFPPVVPNTLELNDKGDNDGIGGIMDGGGKDKMMWVRRAFFMSTEKIFPGFIRNYGLRNNRSRDPTGVKLRTSIPLKMCLLAHSYFVPIWFVAFLCLQEYATTSLKPIHSYVHTSLAYACMFIDIFRLYGGFISNTKDDMQLLALYWMATVILQTPMMCFVFATHSFSLHILPMNVAMDIILACILLLEIWFGFWQLKGLVSSEMNLLHMARQMNEMMLLQEHEPGKNDGAGQYQYQPRVINDPDKGPYLNWSGAENDNDNDNADSGHSSGGESEEIENIGSINNTKRTNNNSSNNINKAETPTKKGKKSIKSILKARGIVSSDVDENQSASENEV